MKIKKLHLKDHPFFGTTEIDFTNPAGEPLNTVVLAGINGSGKTTILLYIQELLKNGELRHDVYDFIDNAKGFGEYIVITTTKLESEIIRSFNTDLLLNDIKLDKGFENNTMNPFNYYVDHELYKNRDRDNVKNDIKKRLPKCIFLPSESHFDRINITSKPYTYNYMLFNKVDETIAESIPAYFATFIDKKVYENSDLPTKDSIRNACDEINSVLEKLDTESRLIGLKKDGSRMPIFQNRSEKEFDIQGLSSGEKQLFFRIMALKMFEVNNSVILVDEPEISLHPAWQQKILNVYEHIGENNQVIVATHSPHIIASTPKENVKILTRNEATKAFQMLDYKDIHVTKGAPVERILKDVMGLPTTRDPEVQEKITLLWEMIYKGAFETDQFSHQYQELERLLSTLDDDLVLMKMEIGKQKWEREHQYAQSK